MVHLVVDRVSYLAIRIIILGTLILLHSIIIIIIITLLLELLLFIYLMYLFASFDYFFFNIIYTCLAKLILYFFSSFNLG